jgi:hypothetical protein
MPANTAWAGVAPNASTIRGRWAAIAEVTVQAASGQNASGNAEQGPRRLQISKWHPFLCSILAN